MLLFLALWALVPCLVLVTLYFLSSVGGKSGGNKKNDGVKVGPPRSLPGPASGSILPTGPGSQGWGKTQALLMVFWADALTPAAMPSPDPETWALMTRIGGGRRGRGRIETGERGKWPGVGVGTRKGAGPKEVSGVR